MSTKVTIAYDKNFHLYHECWEKFDTVYLTLNGEGWEASTSTSPKKATLKLDIKTWRALVEKWNSTHWAQQPELDGTDPDEDYDAESLVRHLEKLSQ